MFFCFVMVLFSFQEKGSSFSRDTSADTASPMCCCKAQWKAGKDEEGLSRCGWKTSKNGSGCLLKTCIRLRMDPMEKDRSIRLQSSAPQDHLGQWLMKMMFINFLAHIGHASSFHCFVIMITSTVCCQSPHQFYSIDDNLGVGVPHGLGLGSILGVGK